MSVDYTPLTQREWRKVAGRMAEEADQLRAERDVLKKHHDLWKLAAIQNARRADLMGEAADAALAALREYEAWEADLILEAACWADGLPMLTQDLYDRFIAIQTKRNAVLSGQQEEA